MGGTRFMVFKAKDMLKTAVFAVLGVIIILVLITFITSRGGGSALYTPGTYTSEITLNEDNIQVQVTVTDSKIKEVALIHTSETLPVFYPLFSSTMDIISEQVVAEQSTQVELPAEASVTGQLLLDAVDQALSQAALN